ncbi:MAG: hypothetical protein U0640_02570 [Phycisphaerales bacterium]
MKNSLLAGFLVVTCGTAAHALPPRYTVDFLAADFYAMAMSRSGVAAGYDNADYMPNRESYYGVFLDSTRRIGIIGNDEFVEIDAVNDAGEVAGVYMSDQTNRQMIPCVATEFGGRTLLPMPQDRQGFITHISNSGIILGGVYEVGGLVPTTWTRTENGFARHELALPAESWRGLPRTMSSNGVIAGHISETENESKPAMWAGNEFQLLSLPDGFSRGSVARMLGDDVMYGHVWNDDYGTDARMAMWEGGQVQLLPPLGNSLIQGVGPSGEVLAMQFGTPYPPPVWLLHDDEWISLASLIDSDVPFSLTDVVGIDESGRILAHGTFNEGDIDSQWGLVRLVPVPSPGVVGVGAVWFAVMGCARRRDRA